MLDLDSLAEKRARSLNQTEAQWRTVIWSPSFQKISSQMSDGEVEALIDLCPSEIHLQNAVAYLEKRSTETGKSPFTIITEDSQAAGQPPEKWISSLKGNG